MWDKTKKIVLLVLVIIGAVFLVAVGVNVGGLINQIIGRRYQEAEVKGENASGTVTEIKPNANPFRDKTVIETAEGDKIKLPEGVKDKDVDHVVKVENDYKVEVKTKRRLTQ